MQLEAKTIKQIFAIATLTIFTATVHAGGTVQRFSTAGSWSIYKKSEGDCFAEAPAYPPKTARVDVLALMFDRSGAFLALTDPRFNFPKGSYPIGLKHNGTPRFDGSVTGVVLPNMNRAILIRLADPKALNGVITAVGITITLGTHEHFFSTEGGVEAVRAIVICEKNGIDPFASDPTK